MCGAYLRSATRLAIGASTHTSSMPSPASMPSDVTDMTPPSTYLRPPIRTGSYQPGTEHEAATASARLAGGAPPPPHNTPPPPAEATAATPARLSHHPPAAGAGAPPARAGAGALRGGAR